MRKSNTTAQIVHAIDFLPFTASQQLLFCFNFLGGNPFMDLAGDLPFSDLLVSPHLTPWLFLFNYNVNWCASGCVVECRICNRRLHVRISAWATSYQGLLSLTSLRGR